MSTAERLSERETPCEAPTNEFWHSTRLKLDELITRRYALDDVNQAYADMRSGVNIRGAVDFIPAG
jgi:Zn-dependent alcohol dehydrogenase